MLLKTNKTIDKDKSREKTHESEERTLAIGEDEVQEQTQEVAKNLLSEFEKDDTLEPDSFLFKDSRFLTKIKNSQAPPKEVNEVS